MAGGYLKSEFVPSNGLNQGAYGRAAQQMAPKPYSAPAVGDAASGAAANPALKSTQGKYDPSAAAAIQGQVPDMSGQFPAQQPYANQWSLQGGFDMSGPGAAEDAYARYGQQLANPGATEGFASNAMGNYGAARGATASGQYTGQYNPMAGTTALQNFAGQKDPFGSAQSSTAAGQYWNSLQGQSNVPKDMSAYYNRASDRAASDINRQASARGMYNSSAAMDQLGRTEADIRSQQAKDEAAYGLQSAGLQNQIMSGAAQAADQSTANRYGQGLQTAQALGSEGLSRYAAGLQGAGQADATGLGLYGAGLQTVTAADAARNSRYGLLGQGAAAADASRQGRVGSVYDNLTGLTDSVNSTLGGSYSDMFGADQGLYDMGQQLSLGSGLANLAGVQNLSALNMAAGQGAGQSFAGAGKDVQNVLALTKKGK